MKHLPKFALVAALVLCAGIAFADGFRAMGSRTHTVEAYGPADVDLLLPAIPKGIETVTIRLSLTLDELASITHPPFPPGMPLGSFTWSTDASVSMTFPGTDLPVATALADSSVGIGWPLDEGGGAWFAVTPGAEYVFENVPAWSLDLLCKVRFDMAVSSMSCNVAPCAMTVEPLQVASVTVEW